MPKTGFEPVRLAAAVFETAVSAVPPHGPDEYYSACGLDSSILAGETSTYFAMLLKLSRLSHPE